MTSLVPVDPSSAVAVTSYLEQAKTWLATAVENTGPEQIARAKAEIATAAEATRQLHLSQEIQDDAQEMVRRAEYALGKSIIKGRDEGMILRHGETLVPNAINKPDVDHADFQGKRRATDFASRSDLYGTRADGALALAEATSEQFEQALAEARAEDNLSRANVVRKVSPKVITRDMRAEMIRNLAEQGYTSRQMPEKVGVTEESIRLIARDFDIDIPADKVVGKQRRMNHTQMVEQTVIALSNEVDALKYIDFAEVDFSEAGEWVASLSQSISKLRKFANRIKETTHVV